jgi:hypothetical protein
VLIAEKRARCVGGLLAHENPVLEDCAAIGAAKRVRATAKMPAGITVRPTA